MTSSTELCVAINLFLELISYNARPDDNANSLAKNVLFNLGVEFLSSLRGLRNAKALHCTVGKAKCDGVKYSVTR